MKHSLNFPSQDFITNISLYNKGIWKKDENSVIKLCNVISENMGIIESCMSFHHDREMLSTFANRISENFSKNSEIIKTAIDIQSYVNSYFFNSEDPIKHILSFLFSKRITLAKPSCGLESISLISKSFYRYSIEYKKLWVNEKFFPLKRIYGFRTADKAIECIQTHDFKKINFHGISGFNDAHLKAISELNVTSLKFFFAGICPRMESLEKLICNGIVDDKCLENIVDACPNLTSLDLSICVNLVTDIGMSILKGLPKLKKFKFNSFNIIDKGVGELKNLSNLVEIDIINTYFTFKSLLEIVKANQSLIHLNFFISCLNDDELSQFAKYVPNLKSINLKKTKVSQKGLLELSKICYNLKFLSFESADMNDQELLELGKKFTKIKNIGLFLIPVITIKGMLSFMEASSNLKTILSDRKILTKNKQLKEAYPNIGIKFKFEP